MSVCVCVLRYSEIWRMSAGLNCESTLSKSYSLRLGVGSSDAIVALSADDDDVDVVVCADDEDVSVPFSLGLLTS